MRSIEDTRQRWRSLFNCKDTPSDLRIALQSEQGENPCNDGLRSICWKAFLLFDDLDRTQWHRKISESRTAYAALKDHFLKYIDHPDDLHATSDPLADDEESPWQTLRRDEQLRAEISQDVDRCLQENYFFQEPTTKRQMTDVLFIYTKLNPDLGYRQGMHELLAPILWVVDRDATEADSLGGGSPDEEDNSMLQLLDVSYVEHDSFALFCAVMQTVRVYYEHSESRSPSGQVDVIPIVARSHYVHDELLMATDIELAEHLQAQEIQPQIFLNRWMRLLFGREFSFDEVLTVWDLLFAEGLSIELIEFVCVAMLLRIRWQLLDADCTGALMLLLRYPHPHPHAPETLVHDGIYLEQKPTSDRGRFIISKYSGKPTELSKPAGQLNTRLASTRRSRFKRDMRGVGESTSAGSSGRNSPKGLETFFQDVSDGIQRRTETWGVTKAVRGAVSEARRNIQTIQSEANFPSFNPREATYAQESSATTHLKNRIEQLEERNKALAKTLGQALHDLRSQIDKVENVDAATTDSMRENLSRIQSVQTCLENPAASLETLEQRSMSDNDQDGKSSERSDSNDDSVRGAGKECDGPSMNAERTSSSSPVYNEPRKLSIASTSNKPTSSKRPSIRPSLAESEFSWMLGGGRHISSFVSSASVPPEQTRHKQGALFGNGEDSQRKSESEPDGLAVRMKSLRGPKRPARSE